MAWLDLLTMLRKLWGFEIMYAWVCWFCNYLNERESNTCFECGGRRNG